MNRQKLIILDRDGVINQDSPFYIKSPDELVLLPGSAEAIGKLTASGYKVALATNQSGIARGYYTEETLDAIHDKLKQSLAVAGGVIDLIVFCPHLPEFGCLCRKPNPGMLLHIANYFRADMSNVPFIGDRISDIIAAERAGAKPMLVLSDQTERAGLFAYSNVSVFPSLACCVDILLNG